MPEAGLLRKTDNKARCYCMLNYSMANHEYISLVETQRRRAKVESCLKVIKSTHCVDEVYSYCLCSFLSRYWRLETISVPYAVCRPLDGT